VIYRKVSEFARRCIADLDMDRAVVFGLAARVWQFLAGPLTAILVTSNFSGDAQGFYYTFASFLALQSFVELGLHTIVIYFASHEWASLRLGADGNIAGESGALNRLAALSHSLIRWYAGVALLFVPGVSIVGFLFFRTGPDGVDWLAPWLVVVALSGLSLWLLPFFAILEGCQQLAEVNRFRFGLGVLANVAVWISLAFGAGLWTAAVTAAVKVIGECTFLVFKYRRFFSSLRRQSVSTGTFRWKQEIWPLQWRIAVQGVTGYFSFAFVTPVLFHYHGATVGGQMGLTWTVLAAVQGVGQAWVQPCAPRFGSLISQRRFKDLDELFKKVTITSTSVVAVGCVGLLALVVILQQLQPFLVAIDQLPVRVLVQLSEGLLDPVPVALFGLCVIVGHIISCTGIYIRSHKRDPLLVISTVANVSIGILVVLAGRDFGATGAAAAFLAVELLIDLPGYWAVRSRCRRKWHPALIREIEAGPLET
jgi:hypothetical protein